ncbi:SGNH/GDSL hydrolase family protein [Aspergillus lucknowensis]|uniref:GDSL lipase/acylhydrolase family protein n=1 Tax=Aspergillus lucknowensis TaxID=176173 RepID=A0ABR4LUM4_9EURO
MCSLRRITGFLLLASTTLATPCPSHHWGPEEWKALVTFGNSYTDDSRLGYFGSHDGEAPPVGWEQPVSNASASGGYNWGHFASQSADLKRYNYAVSGAVCSNKITPRTFDSIGAPFPSVLEYEIPAYIADSEYITPDGTKFMDAQSEETVYAIWIGTNDVGNGAFLTDAQVNGATIPDYIDCIYEALDRVYANGGRYFVIMNLAPLQLSPQYATPENGGLSSTSYYPDKGANITEISYRMWETVVTVNSVLQYRTPFEVVIARRYPGAQFAVMDTYGLISDIYYHPTRYLETPANVTGYVKHCDKEGQNCTEKPNAAAYLWYDELHPSERTDEVIGKEFVKVVEGESRWATYW